MWSWQLQSDQLRKGLAEFLNNDAPQAQKYVISQVPLFNKSPMRNWHFDALGIGRLASRDEAYWVTNGVVKNITETSVKATYLELDHLGLFEQAPQFQGALIYYDESHLNEVGVLNYARQVREVFESIMKNYPALTKVN